MGLISIYKGNKNSNQVLLNVNKELSNILGVCNGIYFNEHALEISSKPNNNLPLLKINYRYYWAKKRFYNYGNVTINLHTSREALIGKWDYEQQENTIKLTRKQTQL